MDLLLNNLQSLICHKTQPTNQPAETITNSDYADDLVLLANTPAQAQIPLV